MKFKFYILILLLLIYSCDRQLVGPLRDNPFDSESGLTSENPFNLQTQNLSGHILVNWEYTYEKPVIEKFILYRANESVLDTLYTGMATTFEDSDVKWDSTYSYYVTGMINEKETSPPDISDIPEVIRRIYVGEGSDYTTIGDAMNALKDGDVIYVKDGTYTETIDFKGKDITLRSENGSDNCILDGENTRRIINFESGEGENTLLYGFTIKNGGGGHNKGGGIFIDASSPTIRNCIIENNSAGKFGGGIYLDNSSTIIDSCIIRNNISERGGGVSIKDGAPIITNCRIENNISEEKGGGIYYENTDEDNELKLEGCVLGSNTSQHRGGGLYIEVGFPQLILCTFEDNIASEGGAVYIFDENDGFLKGERFCQFTKCKFINNSAQIGGGFFVDKNTSTSVKYSIIVKNESTSSIVGGGGIFVNNSSLLKIDHSTFSLNKTNNLDGGSFLIYSSIGEESEVNISNSIIYKDQAETSIKQDYDVEEGIFNISFTQIQDGFFFETVFIDGQEIEIGEELQNSNLNPLFVDPENDFHLQEGSPCIDSDDAGNNKGGYGGIYENWE